MGDVELENYGFKNSDFLVLYCQKKLSYYVFQAQEQVWCINPNLQSAQFKGFKKIYLNIKNQALWNQTFLFPCTNHPQTL